MNVWGSMIIILLHEKPSCNKVYGERLYFLEAFAERKKRGGECLMGAKSCVTRLLEFIKLV